MKNKIFAYLSVLLGLFFWTVPALSNNTVVVSGGQGNPDEEITLTVSLNSTEPISALQISTDLGEVASAVAGSASSAGRASKHTASCGTKDGITSFLLFSTAMAEIEAGEGIIGEFKIKLGAKPLKLKPTLSVKATDADGEELFCTASGMEITINSASAEYPEGNVYDFGSVPLRQSYSKNIPIRNAGTSPLEITATEFSSDDFICKTPLPIYIQEGLTSNLTIEYSPSKRGNVSETIKIFSNSSYPDNTLRLLASPFAVNEIIVENASGNSDTEIEIPVSMKNMDLVTGFTLEFQLPSHLKYVDGSFRLSDRKVDHQLTASFKEGKLSATAYSLSDTPFSGEEGVLAYFNVVPEGRTSVSLLPSKAVLAALVDGEIMNVTSATYPGRISISYPSLSTSSSVSMGRVPVTQPSDVTLLIRNYGNSVLIIDKIVCDNPDFEFDKVFPVEIQPYETFNLNVVNNSKVASSFKSLIQIYNNDPDNRLVTVTVSGERYAPNALSLTAEPVLSNAGVAEINLCLENYDGISGLQFDLNLPEGFESLEPIAVERGEGFTVNFSNLNNNTVRYLIYSLNGSAIEPGKGSVISLPFKFNDDIPAGSYKFSLTNIKLSDTAGVNCSSDITDPSLYLLIEKYVPVTSISIVNAPKYLEIPGGEISLAVSIEPIDASIKDIEWSSSDVGVATVDHSGKVVAQALGDVSISATSLDSDNIKATVDIPIIGKEFKVTYYVDDKEYETRTVRYGSDIIPIPEPSKEGYTFSGWRDIPDVMPAEDINIYGSFTVNSYIFTFYIDNEVLEQRELEYGSVPTFPQVEEKEGYTFSGWTDLPEIVPAHDVDVHGTYNINSYNLSFFIDGEIFSQSLVEYGSAIVCPVVNEREGYTFSGWGEVPQTMPAHDVEIHGSFNVNHYSISFFIDGVFLEKREFEYGSKVTAPVVEEREDYVFSGWIDLPEIMPAQNLEIHGSYISTVERFLLSFYVDGVFHSSQELKAGVNIIPPVMEERPGFIFTWDNLPDKMPGHHLRVDGYYISKDEKFNLSYFIDNNLYKSYSLGFTEPTVIPEDPVKEGYSFTGWSEIPETMPHYDVNVNGSFIIDSYKISFYLDGQLLESKDLEYGAKIIPPAVAEREGYTFSGWEDLPETMPAHDVDVNGHFTVNEYTLTFIIDGEIVKSGKVAFGSEIVAPTVEEREGYRFSGWNNLPSIMPAHDVEVTGSYIVNGYMISFYLDGQLLESKVLEYGSKIIPPVVAEREGYTFSGWEDLPETMPAHDVEVNGHFTVNSYLLTFYLDGEVMDSFTLEYGTSIIPPSVPEKEGYSFSGWIGLPEIMPAKNVDVFGTYDINSYKLSFFIDGLLYESRDVPFGSIVTAPEIENREGYTFSGWIGLPLTMPAKNVDVNGSFSINSYKAYFYLDDELIETKIFEYGVSVVAPEIQEKTGYTFSGWQDLPVIMPARDIEVRGYYAINSYTLNFYIDGKLFESKTVEFNAQIVAPEVPEKEGYTFSGWDNLPKTMPAQDLHIQGSYIVNQYLLTFYLDDVIFDSHYQDFGSEILAPVPETDELTVFNGWIEEVPKYMPAHDLDIHGTTSKSESGIESIFEDQNLKISIYSTDGLLLKEETSVKELKSLSKGVYIIIFGDKRYKISI